MTTVDRPSVPRAARCADAAAKPRRAVLFDFDGTLVDSCEGIIVSLRAILRRASIAPVEPVGRELIGPPLQRMLELVTGSTDRQLITRLAADFKAEYDDIGYRATVAYPGVEDMLADLAERAIPLIIVTNKRAVPTGLILAQMRWQRFFAGVYSLDGVTPAAPDKAHLVAEVLKREVIDPSSSLLVGDTGDDHRAARLNGLRFLGASWGYGFGDPSRGSDVEMLRSPAELPDLVARS